MIVLKKWRLIIKMSQLDIKQVYQISEMLLDGELNNIGGYLSYSELKDICNNDILLTNTVMLDLLDRGIVEQRTNPFNKIILVRIE